MGGRRESDREEGQREEGKKEECNHSDPHHEAAALLSILSKSGPEYSMTAALAAANAAEMQGRAFDFFFIFPRSWRKKNKK